ncbi:hypothetical protein BHE74_00029084 [Ensete ventricosum]|nr:hypothetical protein BHE74_00029084 [Ensete ventricosum]
MVANRSESEGNSNGGGRRGQQRRRLRLRCDFVAASGVSSNKGATAIGGRWAAMCMTVAEERNNGMEQKIVVVMFNLLLAAIKNWQRTIVVGCDVNRLQRKITAGSILRQGSLLAAIKEDGSKRSLLTVLCSERCMLRLKG